MRLVISPFFFFNDTATTEIYTLSLHDALPICYRFRLCHARGFCGNTSNTDAHEEISLQNVERPRERTSDPICFFAKSRNRQRLSGLSFRFTFRFNFRCPCSGCGTECGLLGSFARSRPSLFLVLARRVELIAPERT